MSEEIETVEAETPTIETEAAESEQAETPETETPAQEEKRLTEAEWLKKERNVVSRRDKQIGKYRAQLEAAQAEISKYQRTQQPSTQQTFPAELKEPQPQDFPNDYTGYLRSLAKFDRDSGLREVEQRINAKETHSVSAYREQQFLAASDTALQQATLEYAKAVPNIEAMIEEHGQTIANFPDSIKRVIREVDPQDVIKAFHAMVESDTLEDLADMTPVKAAAAIAKAASMPTKPVAITKAPAPMAAARGTGAATKTLTRMSPAELVDWVNS
jgi:hypothetical protein